MPTIFITSFHPHISRNILQTKTFEVLKAKKDLKIVLIVPAYKTDYFREQFGSERVFVEGVQPFQASATKRGLFFKKLGIFLFDTKSARQRKQYDFYISHKYLPYMFSMMMGWLGRSFFIRKVVRFLDLHISPKGFFEELILRYKPTLIFSTDFQNENDVSLMQEGRVKGIPSVGMVRSWDNTTLRIFRIFPDYLFVGSETLREEAIELGGYSADRIQVLGNPHFDRSVHGPSKSREAFFKEFNFDPKKKLIMYAPVSDALIRDNDMDQFVLEFLGKIDANILVRFPPEKGVKLVNFIQPKHMVFDRPGFAFKGDKVGDREIRPDDDRRLIDSLSYSDVVVTGPTSICLDAALFDRPVIAVDMYPTKRHFFETVWRYQDNHIQKMLKTGGVAYVTKAEQFIPAIEAYLADPQKDKEGRAKIRSLWFSKVDGHSGERVGNELLKLVAHYENRTHSRNQ